MQLNKSDLPVSQQRLAKVRKYIAAHAPLVPRDYRLVVDEKALECLLPEALSASRSFIEKLLGKPDEISRSPHKLKRLKGILLDQFNHAAGIIPFHARELEDEAAVIKRNLVMMGPDKLTLTRTPEEKMQIFREWLCLRHALVKAGAHLEIISPSAQEGGYREVYTRDRYVMIGDTAYLPDPRELQRLYNSGKLYHYTDQSEIECYKGEIAQIEKALKARGVKTVMVDGAWFEGGNVVRHFSSRTIFVGLDQAWSSKASAQKLLSAINETPGKKWALLAVPLTNFDMYHMDTGMSEELPHGEVMLSPLVTDKKTYQKIFNIVGAKNVIELTDREAKSLATNMIDVGDTLIMTGTCEGLRKKLTARGYKVVMPNDYGLSSLEFGGGGVHCMTNDVQQPRRKQRAPRSL